MKSARPGSPLDENNEVSRCKHSTQVTALGLVKGNEIKISNELPVPPAAIFDKESTEILRVWIAKGDQHVSLRGEIWEDPATWGIMLVDLARHVAKMYSESGTTNQVDILNRIRQGFDIEWSESFE